jgi:hypothetical protein
MLKQKPSINIVGLYFLIIYVVVNADFLFFETSKLWA